MDTLLDELEKVLQEDERVLIDGSLAKNKIVELALKLDKTLLRLLLKNERLKNHFFEEVDGTNVFDKLAFQDFLSNKEFLPDSYTHFKNKIGLSENGVTYLKEKNDVSLIWPYKDCVLEGGQTSEDTKRKEIFWNETLAPDQIDRLLDPKVLSGFMRYDKEGVKEVKEFSTKDNFVIKGNNLLALHSLKSVFQGKVKLVYIDPPYNTSGAANTFAYNNSFNHSSWLTFMKNRIEAAYHILRDDGLFVISIDHFELFYLGVLLDEVFGRENRMGVVAVVHNPGGRQDDQFFPTAHENMLFFAKDITQAKLHTLGISEKKLKEYKYEDEYGRYKLRGFRRSGSNSLKEERPGLFYSIFYNPKTNEISTKKESGEYIEILPIDSGGIERCWRWGSETLMAKKKKYIEVKFDGENYDLYIKERESDYKGEKAKTIWNKSKYTGQTGTNELKKLFKEKKFSYPKSPHLMADIIKITTDPGDLVLDFFAGSGTTGAVAHKMGRQYILCEQMDYVQPVTVKRLQKVIEGEQGGISKDVEWKGGGSFVYAELMQFNAHFIVKIEKAETSRDLEVIWQHMQESAFLSYKIQPEQINKNKAAFEILSIQEQKRFLIEVLDKNQLYVNLSEMEDEDHQVEEKVKEQNHLFYSLK